MSMFGGMEISASALTARPTAAQIPSASLGGGDSASTTAKIVGS